MLFQINLSHSYQDFFVEEIYHVNSVYLHSNSLYETSKKTEYFVWIISCLFLCEFINDVSLNLRYLFFDSDSFMALFFLQNFRLRPNAGGQYLSYEVFRLELSKFLDYAAIADKYSWIQEVVYNAVDQSEIVKSLPNLLQVVMMMFFVF